MIAGSAGMLCLSTASTYSCLARVSPCVSLKSLLDVPIHLDHGRTSLRVATVMSSIDASTHTSYVGWNSLEGQEIPEGDKMVDAQLDLVFGAGAFGRLRPQTTSGVSLHFLGLLYCCARGGSRLQS